MADFVALVSVTLLAAHLLAMNVPSAAPLICVWLHAGGRRGDSAANAAGRQLARFSLWSLLVGTALGAALIGLLWIADDRDYWDAVQRLPPQAYVFALAELVFTGTCLAVYVGTWDRWRDRPWLHASLAGLATTNLLYHFPPLMIVLGKLAARPELVSAEPVTRAAFRGLLVRPEILAQVLHFFVASAAVSGVALMVIASRRQGAAAAAGGMQRWISAGARIALVASLTQLAVGLWLLVQLPAAARRGLMGGDWPATTLFLVSIVATLGVLHALASVALGDTRRAAVRRSVLLLSTVVLLMSGTLARARQIEASGSRRAALAENRLPAGAMVLVKQPMRKIMNAQVVDLSDSNSGSTARILVSLGFNCFSWRPVLEDGPREMLWADAGFENGDKRPSGSGIPLLFPFPGRIGGTSFQFDGRGYELEPGDAFGNAIHGFVYNRPWRVIEQSDARVVGEFQASVDDPSILERWPADFRLRVSYEVRDRALVSDVRYENTGDGPLPCGFATHAYFRLPLADTARAAETIVTVPVDQVWALENMIPTGQKLPLTANQQLASGLRLGEHQFDTCFTGIRADSDKLVRTRLTDPASGRVVTQTFDATFTQCVVYTPGHREAICMEPYTCVPDAMRLAAEGHETGLQILQPGEFRETTLRIEVNR